MDEPIDPNEPRYCICNQVAYGTMVACDNKGVNEKKYIFMPESSHFMCHILKKKFFLLIGLYEVLNSNSILLILVDTLGLCIQTLVHVYFTNLNIFFVLVSI